MCSEPFSRTARLRAFVSRNEGNVAILFAAVSVPLIVAAGGAVDYAGAAREKHSLQEALDSAVLAGVISDSLEEEEEIAVAKTYFLANQPDDWELSDVSFWHEGEHLVGKATASINTRFLRIVNMPELPASVTSAATKEPYLEPACVMAMHPHRKHTLELKESVSVIGPDCNFYGNSSHPDDVVDPHTADNYLTGKSVQAVGYGHHYLENVTPPVETAPKVLSDPLESMDIPSAGGCSFTGKTVDGVAETLSPGTYCDGLHITGGANVTLDPGTYIITGDEFEVADSTFSGDGVTIVLADMDADLSWTSSTVRLSGLRTGPTAGFVIIGERVQSSHVIDKSTVDLEGVVYLPDGTFDWENTGTPTINAKWTTWIVDGFSWTGDGKISMPFKPDDSDVPYPDKLAHVIPRPGQPRLIH